MSSTGTMWQDVCDGFTMVANVCDFLFAFGQCKHVNSTMTMVQVAIYSTATIFYFCTVFALYFFDDCIACTATAQKGV